MLVLLILARLQLEGDHHLIPHVSFLLPVLALEQPVNLAPDPEVLALDHDLTAEGLGDFQVLLIPLVELDGVLTYHIILVPTDQINYAYFNPTGECVEAHLNKVHLVEE